MSPLRKLLKHSATYLAILALLVAAAYADNLQPSDRQLTSRVLHCRGALLPERRQSRFVLFCPVPLSSHLLPLLHRNRASLRIAPRPCLDCGPPLALPKNRSSWHRRPGSLAEARISQLPGSY
jgi:hypothetical protein